MTVQDSGSEDIFSSDNGARSMYCARPRRAEAPRAPTRTALWAEDPVRRLNPGEAVLRVAAFEEPCDDTFLDATAEPATRRQLGRMPGGALI